MTKYINVRGCNGSGKTTVLRNYAQSIDPTTGGEIKTINVEDVGHKPIPFTFLSNGVAILGDYTLASHKNTTSGCDRVKTQLAVKTALERVPKEVKAVLFEGVIVSTIFQPWSDWSKANGGMIWAFLDTPLDLCLQRIQERNGGKEINAALVGDKHKGIERLHQKAKDADEVTFTLDHTQSLADLAEIINDLT